MRTFIVQALLCLLASGNAYGQLGYLPSKSTIASNPANFCKGMSNVFAITKQDVAAEVNYLCAGQIPTQRFSDLMTSAYQGGGTRNIVIIEQREDQNTKTGYLTVAFSMVFNKNPVQVLLAEEKLVPTNYSQDPLTLTARFTDPPINTGDADTAFTVEQRATVNAAIKFDDVSVHDLKLYQPYLYNFDMFFAARTMRAPSEQFKRLAVTRFVMKSPDTSAQTYQLSVLTMQFNTRDQYDRTLKALMTFIESDYDSRYAFISSH